MAVEEGVAVGGTSGTGGGERRLYIGRSERRGSLQRKVRNARGKTEAKGSLLVWRFFFFGGGFDPRGSTPLFLRVLPPSKQTVLSKLWAAARGRCRSGGRLSSHNPAGHLSLCAQNIIIINDHDSA